MDVLKVERLDTEVEVDIIHAIDAEADAKRQSREDVVREILSAWYESAVGRPARQHENGT